MRNPGRAQIKLANNIFRQREVLDHAPRSFQKVPWILWRDGNRGWCWKEARLMGVIAGIWDSPETKSWSEMVRVKKIAPSQRTV